MVGIRPPSAVRRIVDGRGVPGQMTGGFLALKYEKTQLSKGTPFDRQRIYMIRAVKTEFFNKASAFLG